MSDKLKEAARKKRHEDIQIQIMKHQALKQKEAQIKHKKDMEEMERKQDADMARQAYF